MTVRWPLVQRLAALLALLGLAVLSGCASSRIIDSDVRAFAGSTVAQRPASYRFDRLPSQEAQGASQDRIEAIAESALQSVDLTRQSTAPRYAITVDVRRESYVRLPARAGRRNGIFDHETDGTWPPSMLLNFEQTWYKHNVHLLMRDLGSGQVVFETQAEHNGPWSDTLGLLPAMLEAALRDFPAPPQGMRNIVVEFPSTDPTP